MREKTAIEFLFFSYFNVDLENVKDDDRLKKKEKSSVIKQYKEIGIHLLLV